MKLIRNTWVEVEIDDQELRILKIVYEEAGTYHMQWWDWKESEDSVVEKWLVLWEIFWGKLTELQNYNPLTTLTT